MRRLAWLLLRTACNALNAAGERLNGWAHDVPRHSPAWFCFVASGWVYDRAEQWNLVPEWKMPADFFDA